MAKSKKIDKDMGFRLKKARLDQKLTYDELSEKSGVSSRYIVPSMSRTKSFFLLRSLFIILSVIIFALIIQYRRRFFKCKSNFFLIFIPRAYIIKSGGDLL